MECHFWLGFSLTILFVFNSYSCRFILGLHVSTLDGSSSGPRNNIDPNILLYKYVVGPQRSRMKAKVTIYTNICLQYAVHINMWVCDRVSVD